MNEQADTRRVIQLSRAQLLAARLRSIPSVSVRRQPKRNGYHPCAGCGNPTRGTAQAGDDRCAKCQTQGTGNRGQGAEAA